MKTSSFVERIVRQHDEVAGALSSSTDVEIHALRQQALAGFAALGLPTLRDEAWRYTNMRLMEKHVFKPVLSNQESINLNLKALQLPAVDSYRIIFIDGRLNYELSSIDNLPEGLKLTSLSQVLEDAEQSQMRDRVLELARRRAQHPTHAFDALNTAYISEGAVIALDADLKLDKPIELVSITSQHMQEKILNTCNYLFGGANSSAQIIELHISVDTTKHLTVSSMTAELDEACEIDHYRIQNESPQAVHVCNTTARLAGNARCAIHAHNFGALVSRHDVTQTLTAPYSNSELNGLCVATGRQHMDNYTNIIHDCEHGTSSEQYRSILDDRAKSVFHGRIRVAPDAQKTDAQQQNNNLLLSANADATTKPQLEIYADDVKCSHGATVGELDEHAIFYLQSRGIDFADARAILTRGFASEIVNMVDLEPVREYLTQLLIDKLDNQNKLSKAA